MSLAKITLVLVPNANREPRFEKSTQNLTIQETDEIIQEEILAAIDPDADLGDEFPEIGPQVIYYYIVGKIS